LLDLGQQILGDVNGAGFTFYFVGQVMGQMPFTGLAVATGPTAFSSEGDQAGGDKRAVGFELLEPGLEVTADEGGMLGNFHMGREYSKLMTLALLIRNNTSQKSKQNPRCDELFSEGFRAGRTQVCKAAALPAYDQPPQGAKI
jgi:hypothetical protein